MSNRQGLEAALSATVDRLAPGSGSDAVRHFKNELAMVASPTDEQVKRHAAGEPLLIAPAVFESKQPDGDPVTIGKGREGLLAVFPDGVVYVRGIGFGARESKGLAATDVAVESVTAVLDGAEVPGLRIVGQRGKPKLALAIAYPPAASNAAEQAAVRDELVQLLTR